MLLVHEIIDKAWAQIEAEANERDALERYREYYNHK
jgi:hypothetical protein